MSVFYTYHFRFTLYTYKFKIRYPLIVSKPPDPFNMPKNTKHYQTKFNEEL